MVAPRITAEQFPSKVSWRGASDPGMYRIFHRNFQVSSSIASIKVVFHFTRISSGNNFIHRLTNYRIFLTDFIFNNC